MMALAVGFLDKQKLHNPQQQIVAVRSVETFSLFIKRGIVSGEEIIRLKSFCKSRNFDMIYYPGIERSECNVFNIFPEPIFHDAMRELLDAEKRAYFLKNYIFDVRPTTDDRPFWDHTFRWDKIREQYEVFNRRWAAFFEGGYLVAMLFVQALLLSILLIIIPFLLARAGDRVRDVDGGSIAILFYFVCIGIGYIMIEIVFIQRFITVLEHPFYTTTVVIAGILVSSACGSYFSKDFLSLPGWSVGKHLLLSCAVLLVYLVSLDILVSIVSGSFVLKAIYVGCIVAIPGFLLGVPFPAAIRLLGTTNKGVIPICYCANATASVIASSLTILIALEFGFKFALGIAVLCYFFAMLSSIGFPAFPQSNRPETLKQ
jgi:hypothetical protein